jgi:two-component system OmpR family response regulator
MKGRKPKIFLVEDNFSYSYVLESILKGSGDYQVTTFSTGEECIHMLQNKPDLIILDYNLDGMNGLETIKAIQAKNTEIPVIVLSSQKDVGVASAFLAAGAFDYIEKKSNGSAMELLTESVKKVFSAQ